jgi:phage internal scaffolding protein
MAKKPQVRNAFSRERGNKVNTGKGLTEQSHKKQCDMNYILKDYQRTGMIKHAAKFEGKYDDVSAGDFQNAMFLIKNAQQMFEQLPSSLRKRFGNDPASFLEFTSNPDNKEEMKSLGILKGNDGLDINGAATASPVKTEQPYVDEPPSEKPVA